MRSFFLFLLCLPLFGQATFPTTTTNGQMTLLSAEIPLASLANVHSPGFPTPSGGIGQPSGIQSTGWILLIEQEAVCVDGVWGSTIVGSRGCQGTTTQAHNQGTTVWTGPAYFYHPLDPTAYSGYSCVSAQQYVLPWITLPSGNIWDCTGGFWVLRAPTLRRPHGHVSKWRRLRNWLEQTYP